MYQKSNNNFFHGIMFHHFHDKKIHYKGQGSINKSQFYKIIKYVGKKNIINADDFYQRYKEKKLKKNELCITFDDGLKCQMDIAVPVLEDLGIKGFFFINSSNYTGNPNLIELYRIFRLTKYKHVDEFYDNFFLNLRNKEGKINIFLKKKSNVISHWKKKFPFYSFNDIKFRIVREYFLLKKEYKSNMFKMFKDKEFDYKRILKKIYLTETDIKKLSNLNHFIGLHSHSHPTLMRKMKIRNQKIEYKKNKTILEKIINKKIVSMAHPCGSYSKKTLKLLNDLDINLGFRSTTLVDMNMKKINNSKYEIARIDHSNIMREIGISK